MFLRNLDAKSVLAGLRPQAPLRARGPEAWLCGSVFPDCSSRSHRAGGGVGLGGKHPTPPQSSCVSQATTPSSVYILAFTQRFFLVTRSV